MRRTTQWTTHEKVALSTIAFSLGFIASMFLTVLILADFPPKWAVRWFGAIGVVCAAVTYFRLSWEAPNE